MRYLGCAMAVALLTGCGTPPSSVATATPAPRPTPTPAYDQRVMDTLTGICSEPPATLLREARDAQRQLAAEGVDRTLTAVLAGAGTVTLHATWPADADGRRPCSGAFIALVATGDT